MSLAKVTASQKSNARLSKVERGFSSADDQKREKEDDGAIHRYNPSKIMVGGGAESRGEWDGNLQR